MNYELLWGMQKLLIKELVAKQKGDNQSYIR